MDNNWLNRTEALIGKTSLEKLQKSNVVVFGLGGVGSYVVEGLVRSGIGTIILVDKDKVDITNINRQIIADTITIGKLKVEIEKERILKINPNAHVIEIADFVTRENVNDIMQKIYNELCQTKSSQKNINHYTTDIKINYVVDAIDTISAKLGIINYCYKKGIKIISCMGTGNKLDANKFEITDINNTSVCPLARIIRKELRNMNIPKLKVIYSKEVPINTNKSSNFQERSNPGSISFVPSVAGLLISGEVVKDLII